MELTQAHRTPRAYAVLDGEGTLTFCRSLDRCANGRHGRLTDQGGAVREGTVYAVPEDAPEGLVPWLSVRGSDRAVVCAGERMAAPRSTSRWFYSMGDLTSADLSGIDTSAVEDMRSMFRGCSSLAALDLSGWDISSVRSMHRMFDG